MARAAVKRVTLNLPAALLRKAQSVSQQGITETVVESLELLARRKAAEQARALRGRLKLHIDLEASRERRR
jgi:hypothetical protein